MMMEYFFATATGNNKNDSASHFKKKPMTTVESRTSTNIRPVVIHCFLSKTLFSFQITASVRIKKKRKKNQCITIYPIDYPRRLTVTGVVGYVSA